MYEGVALNELDQCIPGLLGVVGENSLMIPSCGLFLDFCSLMLAGPATKLGLLRRMQKRAGAANI